MNQKLYYMTCGYILTFTNILLIGTRFNTVGILFGLAAMVFFVKSIMVKK